MENRKHYLYEIKQIKDGGGVLSVLEEKTQIPFKVKRIFYEYDIKKNTVRGNHANKKSKFCLICIFGKCDIVVDDGFSKQNYVLDKPNKVLYLDKMIWKTMSKFSDNCILLVLSDSFYNEHEYIREYNDFLKEIKNA